VSYIINELQESFSYKKLMRPIKLFPVQILNIFKAICNRFGDIEYLGLGFTDENTLVFLMKLKIDNKFYLISKFHFIICILFGLQSMM